jgi:protein TonB
MTEAAIPLDRADPATERARVRDEADVLVLSADPAVRAIFKTAVPEPHYCHLVESPDAAVDALVNGPASVLAADLGALRGDIGALLKGIKEQFPDLVLIAIGSREEEAALADLVEDGTLFRYLHKPASPGRASVFVAAAIERHQGSKRSGALRFFRRRRQRSRIAPLGLVAIALLLIASGIAAWLANRQSPTPTVPTASDSTTAQSSPAPGGDLADMLNTARIAMQEDRLVSPAGGNALELYGAVLERNPDEPEALDGMRRVIDRLFTTAEDALARGDPAAAREPLESVRTARPDHPRLRFLDAQIARAQAAADAARRARLEPKETPQQAEVRRLLGLADRRLAAGRVVAADGDDARRYVLRARSIDRSNSEARSVASLVGATLVKDGESALQSGDLPTARRMADAAVEFARAARMDIPGATALSRKALTAQQGATEAAVENHLELAAQRIEERAWLAPVGDSARDHLIGARMHGADDVAISALEQRLVRGLYGATETAIAADDLTGARELLEAAARMAPNEAAPTRLAEELANAEARRAFLRDVQPAANYPRKRQPAPSYPADALRRGLEGWVEVEFTIATDGKTRDFVVRAAEPADTFDEAAVSALSSWRFEPIVRNGAPAEQRAAIRLRFQLQE